MRKAVGIIVLFAAVSAIVLVGGALPVVSQQPAERQTFTLFDPQATQFEKFINQGKRGISPGDVVLFVEKQLDPDTCEKAGKLVGRIQIVKNVGKQNALFQGSFTLLLSGGKITAGGAAKFSDFMSTDPIFAVTGGTGTYRDASGEVTLTEDAEMCGEKGSLTTIDVGPVR